MAKSKITRHPERQQGVEGSHSTTVIARSEATWQSHSSPLLIFLIAIPICLLVILNLLLAFTPEIGFDALWYHLTLPKLWLLKHQWYFPGGLLYYSVMPRLAETLFIPLIALTGTIGPKLLQYIAGLGTGLIIWKILANLKQSPVMRLVGVSLFYCTWLVSWQSGSAYIDLVRTFFETLALFYLLNGSWKKGGLLLGLAIGTKWLSLGSLFIYALVFGPSLIFPALFVSLPWFAVAYYYTGNPLYPIFSGVIQNSFSELANMFKHLVLTPYYLTKPFDDFLSPLIGLLFIMALLSLRHSSKVVRQISLVAVLGIFFSLVLDPPSSRFLLPFLPALAISSVMFVSTLKNSWLIDIFIYLTIISGFLILFLRSVAFQKYIPLFTGLQNQNDFLTAQYSRLPGTFIDNDGFVASLPSGSRILVDKLHNLYYFPRDFTHTSWVKPGSAYDFLVTIGEDSGSVSGELIHTNSLGIQVFKLK